MLFGRRREGEDNGAVCAVGGVVGGEGRWCGDAVGVDVGVARIEVSEKFEDGGGRTMLGGRCSTAGNGLRQGSTEEVN
jgi:hypothetical protein